jgi:hypothetical protein
MTAASSLLPGFGFILFALAGYGFNLWVLKKNTLGGLVWFLPFFAAAGTGIFIYRKQCLQAGVLTDRESVEHGRNMLAWVLLCSVLVLGVLQKSLAGALLSALLGAPMFLVLLAGGMFFVKTQLLMQNQPERDADSHLGASDLEAFQAEFRRARGINEVKNPAAEPPARGPSAQGDVHAQLRVVQHGLPKSARPTAPSPAAPLPPRSTPQEEAEIRRKILKVRAAALKAQRKAEKSARS